MFNFLKPRRRRIIQERTAWVPDRTTQEGEHELRYKGSNVKKPWDYACEVCIPVLDTPELLFWVISLLRLQTARPHIIVIDTGSTAANYAKIEAFRAQDVEVHCLRMNAVHHPSDFPAIACDVALSMCRTDYLFLTHADVFPRRKDLLEDYLASCNASCPAVGYQMSPREHPGWENMVSHTATMLHVPTIDRIGGGYSLRRLCNNEGIEHKPNAKFDNWPDTEILMSMIFDRAGITPMLIGTEQNKTMTLDENIRHCRSFTAARLYAPAYARECQKWIDETIEEAKANIFKWMSP